jgi:hypothetical protein
MLFVFAFTFLTLLAKEFCRCCFTMSLISCLKLLFILEGKKFFCIRIL